MWASLPKRLRRLPLATDVPHRARKPEGPGKVRKAVEQPCNAVAPVAGEDIVAAGAAHQHLDAVGARLPADALDEERCDVAVRLIEIERHVLEFSERRLLGHDLGEGDAPSAGEVAREVDVVAEALGGHRRAAEGNAVALRDRDLAAHERRRDRAAVHAAGQEHADIDVGDRLARRRPHRAARGARPRDSATGRRSNSCTRPIGGVCQRTSRTPDASTSR